MKEYAPWKHLERVLSTLESAKHLERVAKHLERVVSTLESAKHLERVAKHLGEC